MFEESFSQLQYSIQSVLFSRSVSLLVTSAEVIIMLCKKMSRA